ncbi:MAG: hypothetical protein ACK2T2_15785 [Anaerolineales bacterium]|jgi:hypothetical protein
MQTHDDVQAQIPLPHFDHLKLRDPVNQVELVIVPAETCAVAIRSSDTIRERIRCRVREGILEITLAGNLVQRIQDALTTSLTRETVRLEVSAPGLRSIDVLGWIAVDTRACGAQQPRVIRGGPIGKRTPFPPWN